MCCAFCEQFFLGNPLSIIEILPSNYPQTQTLIILLQLFSARFPLNMCIV